MYKSKIFLQIIVLLFLTSTSNSEINPKSWSKQCNENKNSCIIAISSEIKVKDKEGKQTLATAYIQIGSSKKKIMDLVDKEDQTYKLSEKNQIVPVLFVNLPLNADLRKPPIVQYDDNSLGNLTYLHCNANVGCKSVIIVNKDVITTFKKGKTLSIILGIFGSKNNLKIDFPLKGFTKAYGQLLKG